ncbi:hypothetical protein Sjap_018760 [Stephania japonica]|uniref:Ribosomal protein eL8/eL30/eS12/Gadd45 domain-containing protein n=1 Tax=Stephania japonica TaxID=461633 RepID=A0AAP0I8Q2_9MAGN
MERRRTRGEFKLKRCTTSLPSLISLLFIEDLETKGSMASTSARTWDKACLSVVTCVPRVALPRDGSDNGSCSVPILDGFQSKVETVGMCGPKSLIFAVTEFRELALCQATMVAKTCLSETPYRSSPSLEARCSNASASSSFSNGGMVLHKGEIAEMRTGEGKTLVVILSAYLNRVIEKYAAQLCVLAEDCDQADYAKLVKVLCANKNVNLTIVPSAKTLGEWAGLCKIDYEGKARKVVSCSCIVVKNYGEESEGLHIVQEDEYYAWGLRQIAKASVVVTQKLDWKLHAFDVLSEFDGNSQALGPIMGIDAIMILTLFYQVVVT